MDALVKNKGAILGGTILLVGLFAYNNFMGGTPEAALPAQNSGADLIKLSEDISKATLPRELFTTTGYRLLSDWSVPLIPQPMGRANPFAPIGQ
jgi:hypothetical protein